MCIRSKIRDDLTRGHVISSNVRDGPLVTLSHSGTGRTVYYYDNNGSKDYGQFDYPVPLRIKKSNVKELMMTQTHRKVSK